MYLDIHKYMYGHTYIHTHMCAHTLTTVKENRGREFEKEQEGVMEGLEEGNDIIFINY